MLDNEPVDPLDIDFLKDRYDFELERKEKLTDALTLPIGVLTVLGSIVLEASSLLLRTGADGQWHSKDNGWPMRQPHGNWRNW